jgi:hypothetical protein
MALFKGAEQKSGSYIRGFTFMGEVAVDTTLVAAGGKLYLQGA